MTNNAKIAREMVINFGDLSKFLTDINPILRIGLILCIVKVGELVLWLFSK